MRSEMTKPMIEIPSSSSRQRFTNPFCNHFIIFGLVQLFIFLLSACNSQSSTIILQTQSITETQPTIHLTLFPTSALLPTFTPQPTATKFELPNPELDGAAAIGWSVAGRRIEVFRFGVGPTQKLLIGGIHGGAEWNTTSLLEELIVYISDHPEMIPKEISLFILPVLNVDGAIRSQGDSGRTNQNGADLNRNWDANWQIDWSRKGCWNQLPTTGGTETIALANFIKSHHFNAIISYHSAGLGIFPGGSPPAENSKSLAKAISAVAPYPYPPIDTGCIYTGAFVDWAANQGIAALDVELRDHFDTDFSINLKILDVFLHWQ
jgi:hypothetical protein